MFDPNDLAVIEPLIQADIERLIRERDAYGDPDMDPTASIRAKRMRIMRGMTIPQVRKHRHRIQSLLDHRYGLLAKIADAEETGTGKYNSARAA